MFDQLHVAFARLMHLLLDIFILSKVSKFRVSIWINLKLDGVCVIICIFLRIITAYSLSTGN
jgi:hypothetical protein